jgi:ketosteroid isomerase-like protein
MRLALVAILLLQQPAPPQRPPRPDLPTQRFVDDMRSKNIEDVLALYTPDAVFSDPQGHTFSTPVAMRKLYQQVFATYDSDLHLNPTSVTVDRDNGIGVAVDSGTYTEDLTVRSTGEVLHPAGAYRFVWKLQPDGHWLLTRMEWKP